MLNDVGVPGRSFGADELPPAEIVFGTVSVELGDAAVELGVALGAVADEDAAGAVALEDVDDGAADALGVLDVSCADDGAGAADDEPVELGVLDVLPEADALWLAVTLALPEDAGGVDDALADADVDDTGTLCEGVSDTVTDDGIENEGTADTASFVRRALGENRATHH